VIVLRDITLSLEQRELLSLLLPTELVAQFDLVHIEQMHDGYHLFWIRRTFPRSPLLGIGLNRKVFLTMPFYGIFPFGAKRVSSIFGGVNGTTMTRAAR